MFYVTNTEFSQLFTLTHTVCTGGKVVKSYNNLIMKLGSIANDRLSKSSSATDDPTVFSALLCIGFCVCALCNAKGI